MSSSTYLILVALIMVVMSCNLEEVPIDNRPFISTISPESGPHGTEVIISGHNFSSVLSENLVRINGKVAEATHATDSTLTVVIPLAAGSGFVNVSVKGLAPANEMLFTYLWMVSTLTGNVELGNTDGNLSEARFNLPQGITVDSHGDIYVADSGNDLIRRISGGQVTSMGSGGFDFPHGIIPDGNGNFFIVDELNSRIRKMGSGGSVITFAGSGDEDFEDGLGTNADFHRPVGLTLDGDGNIYIADSGNHRIRKIAPNSMVTTLVGPGEFLYPSDVAIDNEGTLYVCDLHKVSKITKDGVITQIAASSFSLPEGQLEPDIWQVINLALDRRGNLLMVDGPNHRILMVTPEGEIQNFAGRAEDPGFDSGEALEEASFDTPRGIAVAPNDVIYLVDKHMVRKIE